MNQKPENALMFHPSIPRVEIYSTEVTESSRKIQEQPDDVDVQQQGTG